MRILVLSDIHGNLVALKTVIADAGQFNRIWCLGDVVGYGPEPNACIKTLRDYDLQCIAGNHDWAVLGKLDLEEFNPDARQAAVWTRNQLTSDNLEWLHFLPETIPPQMERFTLVHGSPRYPIWEYVLTPAVARMGFQVLQTPICLLGHTHVPVVFRNNPEDGSVSAAALSEEQPLALGADNLMINPGSVGQPRDGDPRAAYAILDTEANTLAHRRVDYDIVATQLKMEHAGLPARLITRLSYGW